MTPVSPIRSRGLWNSRRGVHASSQSTPWVRAPHPKPVQVNDDAVVAAMSISAARTVVKLSAANMNNFLQGNREKLVVVDYHTPLCGPCKLMCPVMEDMAQEFDDVAFGKFDCGSDPDNRRLALRAGVKALPTFHLYRYTPDGVTLVLAQLTGAKTKELRMLVMQHRKDTA